MAGFRFDCEFVEGSVGAATAESLKRRAKRRREARHRADSFADARAGEPRRNDCGYVLPSGTAAVAVSA